MQYLVSREGRREENSEIFSPHEVERRDYIRFYEVLQILSLSPSLSLSLSLSLVLTQLIVPLVFLDPRLIMGSANCIFILSGWLRWLGWFVGCDTLLAPSGELLRDAHTD